MREPVPTESGQVLGVPGTDRSITVFRGVPYAAAPLGPLRWRPPGPPPAWTGVRAAGTFGPMCPQPDADARSAGVDLPMSEDCLFLNVWTRAPSARERLPVLVWVHGGGFRGGTGADPRYDGERLARKGVVVVTFNYRLGALGFLSTPGLNSESARWTAGNYGLLDCVAVLRWVRRNIAGFGGDPGRVTVAGQSAGAGTANFLAMSPLARGLFHRAVAQSHARCPGDPELRYLATSYRTARDAERAGERYAAARGARSPAELRALPWRRLVEEGTAADAVDDGVETGSTAKPPLFRPVVDGWALPAGYAHTYDGGAQNDVDYLAGGNLDESGAVPEDAIAALRARGPASWRPGAPPVHLTRADRLAAARRKYGPLADEFLRLYPADTDDEAAHAHNRAVRDNTRVSTHLWARRWGAHATRPVHTYFWTHRSPAQRPPRAGHGSEIDYVFGNLDPARAPWTAQDREIAETMSSYWANFAATGDPEGPGLPSWPAYDPAAPAVMEVGARFGPAPVATPAVLDFWRRFFASQDAW
ncbi:carboxylesterase/lipase family protein [Streptomyces sp. NPDC050560]|uniref:carboxylesterase/lipase family protein n=1 Tax=Streptomyces sp. NPDC050560 TaxID=3365630 RepID=UPI0037AEBFC7